MTFEHIPCFPLRRHETATSYVSRLTRYFHVETPHDFCLDQGFRWQDVVRGDDALFERIAAIGGASSTDLKHWAVRTIAPHHFRVAGQEGTKTSLIRTRLRVCPRCLVEDRDVDWRHGAYRRHYWQFSAMRTCHIHQCPIITLPHERYTLQNYNFAGLIDRHWKIISDAAANSEVWQATDLEDYVRSRLDGLHDTPFLDAMPMYIATRLCEVLGFVLLFGATRKISTATEQELSQAGQAGFDALRSGEKGLYVALDSLVAPAALRTVHHQSDLGALFEWLRTSALGDDFEPLKDMVRTFIFKTYPIQEGNTVLGKACQVPQRYTIHGAWQTLGIQRKRMNRILIDKGKAHLSKSENAVRLEGALAATDIARLAAQMHDRLSIPKVCNRLAISADVLQQLRDRSILTPITDALDQVPKYERADVEHLISQVSRRITVRGASFAKLVTIIDASKRVRCPSGDIVALILSGDLQSVGCAEGCHDLSGLRVCIGELRGLLPSTALPGTPKGETSRLLRVTYPTVNYLVREGLLTLERARNPRSRQFIDAVTFESIDAFKAAFITLGQLAQRYGRASGPLGCHLEAKGICPIETPPKISWYYDRKGLDRRIQNAGVVLPAQRKQNQPQGVA